MAIVETAAHGLTFAIGDGTTTPTYNTLIGVHNGPEGGGWEPRIIEAFHHNRNDVLKTATVVDIQPFSFSLYYDSTDTYHIQLRDASKDKTATGFQVTSTETGLEVLTFTAYVGFSFSNDVEGWNVVNVTVTPISDFAVT